MLLADDPWIIPRTAYVYDRDSQSSVKPPSFVTLARRLGPQKFRVCPALWTQCDAAANDVLAPDKPKHKVSPPKSSIVVVVTEALVRALDNKAEAAAQEYQLFSLVNTSSVASAATGDGALGIQQDSREVTSSIAQVGIARVGIQPAVDPWPVLESVVKRATCRRYANKNDMRLQCGALGIAREVREKTC
ncbi:hypothetical protein SARC_06666 [Sphaeroforma arctica JP610]|uniref:Uncharacterized protein n=1 Tax=Sphaeroforma arctica JP610 TaxID=667725 RepID=A0A0L0FVX6_9EUKA|nr:hypothetical protein SARC_06666 [Sphaeroforma arctica JP610]KNC80992.1 hypothetical protein SARC_06666 [Sphaeroforma arctica JP610]|eukprot:XP_014154894.1 hypothetical protein SARC_06666 [Sphaeroforma arctica JP610]